MKKIAYSIILLAFSTLVIIACKHTNNVTPATPATGTGTGSGGGSGTGTGGTDPADTALCFERDVLPIFISNCAKSGCHDAASAQKGYVFTSYQTITSKKFSPGNPGNTELYEKITETKPQDIMPPPPNAPLSQQQKALIYEWIRRGAPNTTNCPTSCDTNNFAFAANIQPIFNKYCIGCHSTASPSKGVSLDNYNGVKIVATDSRLINVLKHTPGYPFMPQGGAQLSDCKIRQVEKWIQAGALNN